MPDVMPILPSWDFDVTAAFFNKLGFAEDGRWPGNYLILRHPDGIELHFFSSQEFDPAHNDHGTYIRYPTASQADALHATWQAIDLDAGTLHPPRDMDYGLREFALLDPMRNLLRVGGPIT